MTDDKKGADKSAKENKKGDMSLEDDPLSHPLKMPEKDTSEPEKIQDMELMDDSAGAVDPLEPPKVEIKDEPASLEDDADRLDPIDGDVQATPDVDAGLSAVTDDEENFDDPFADDDDDFAAGDDDDDFDFDIDDEPAAKSPRRLVVPLAAVIILAAAAGGYVYMNPSLIGLNDAGTANNAQSTLPQVVDINQQDPDGLSPVDSGDQSDFALGDDFAPFGADIPQPNTTVNTDDSDTVLQDENVPRLPTDTPDLSDIADAAESDLSDLPDFSAADGDVMPSADELSEVEESTDETVGEDVATLLSDIDQILAEETSEATEEVADVAEDTTSDLAEDTAEALDVDDASADATEETVQEDVPAAEVAEVDEPELPDLADLKDADPVKIYGDNENVAAAIVESSADEDVNPLADMDLGASELDDMDPIDDNSSSSSVDASGSSSISNVSPSSVTPPQESNTFFDSTANVPRNRLSNAEGPRKIDPSMEPASKFVVVKKTQNAGSASSSVVAGNRALKLGRYDAAAEIFDKLYQANPRDERILMGRAIAYQNIGRDETAIRLYEELLNVSPNNADALVNMLGLIRKQFPEVALRRLTDLYAQYPNNAGIAAQLGITEADLGNTANAFRYLGIASSIEPQNAQHLFNMAVIADRAKNTARAIEFYEQALQADSVYGDSRSVPRTQIYDRLSILRGR